MRVVVIGGSKFVGLHLTRELVSRGHEVTVVNRGQTAKELPAGVGRIIADRKEPAALAARVAEAGPWDAVYDCIAYVPAESEPLVRAVWTDPPGSRRVLKHFVHISTGSVYGKTDYLPLKEHFPCTADSDPGTYGSNKKLIEDLLFAARENEGLPVTILRPGYIYGPDNPIYRESYFFDRVRRGRPVLVPGNGLTITQFVYVDDLARALALVLGNGEAVGEAFNIAGEYGCSLDHYTRLIGEAVGRPADIRHYDPPAAGLSAEEIKKVFPYKWREHTLRDTTKIRQVLGYREKHTLKQGLAEAYRWYVEHWPVRGEPDFTLDDRVLASGAAR